MIFCKRPTRPPIKKFRLKSWQIRNNKIGATPPRTPRTWMMDFKPLRAVHLIDGNSNTYWSSRGQTRPDVEQEWIRIDLASEVVIGSVVLVPRLDNQGWPGQVTIRVSKDAWHWDTVFESKEFSSTGNCRFTKSFHSNLERLSRSGFWQMIFDGLSPITSSCFRLRVLRSSTLKEATLHS